MTDLEYGNRSISSLVQELNNLGNRSVLIQQTQLIAIQAGQNKFFRRFQTKSVPKKQFFKCDDNDKKYFYSHVHPRIDSMILSEFMSNWEKGYNCTILLQNDKQNLFEILKSIEPWLKDSLVFCIVLNRQNQLIDLLGQTQITHRQLLENKKYYEIEESIKIQIIREYLLSTQKSEKSQLSQTFINVTFKHPESCSELNLAFLPSEMFSTECNPPYSLIKTQLTQLLNYIKMNPNKRYEHISKLITKRLPITNFLTKILMSDSCNLLINFIQPQNTQKNVSIAKFQFFDKMVMIGNLLHKTDRHIIQLGVIKLLPEKLINLSESNDQPNPLSITRARQEKSKNSQSLRQDIVSPIGRLNLKTENDYDLEFTEKQRVLEQKEFEFCRSLQRKTHKFSISPRQETSKNHSLEKAVDKNIVVSQVQNFLDKKTISKYDGLSYQGEFNNIQLSKKMGEKTLSNARQWNEKFLQNPVICESQQITLLKAQHARQISQYHQTIQLLNKKILLLTKENNLEELYKIHERQMMLLELKIKELREDIIVLTNHEPSEKAIKSIVKKLTEEVKSYETASTAKKLSQGRIFMLEKQVREVKEKLTLSEKARTTLTLEVQTLTKRLKIRDSQIEKINQEDIQKYQCEDLSLTEEQMLEDIKKLVKAVKEQQRNSVEFLLRKISLILSDLSKSRDIILECNDFLVQLMQILDEKLNNKAPEIVLDCNKFIRGFLMENLSIF